MKLMFWEGRQETVSTDCIGYYSFWDITQEVIRGRIGRIHRQDDGGPVVESGRGRLFDI